jgi:hypothetical protein
MVMRSVGASVGDERDGEDARPWVNRRLGLRSPKNYLANYQAITLKRQLRRHSRYTQGAALWALRQKRVSDHCQIFKAWLGIDSLRC